VRVSLFWLFCGVGRRQPVMQLASDADAPAIEP
jgi:hypothetical protein